MRPLTFLSLTENTISRRRHINQNHTYTLKERNKFTCMVLQIYIYSHNFANHGLLRLSYGKAPGCEGEAALWKQVTHYCVGTTSRDESSIRSVLPATKTPALMKTIVRFVHADLSSGKKIVQYIKRILIRASAECGWISNFKDTYSRSCAHFVSIS